MTERPTSNRKSYGKFTRRVANELYRRFGDVLEDMSTYDVGAFYACLQDELLNPKEVIESTLTKARNGACPEGSESQGEGVQDAPVD